ncbi:uncharacterized protein LOC141589883 [Silene latifolia]|uniref:uncharacterized protein LOC141589883 n=1 Tax=Silene latifolia TaxID=37657 RepID=UPI003D775917
MHVSSIFRFYGFTHHVGVDAEGSKGGLWVGWKPSWNIECITKCPNFIIIKINECGGSFWYVFCIYGSLKRENRESVWLHIEHWISRMDSQFILLGDFNQVEFREDKLGGNKGSIFGAQLFSEWKVRNSLSDIAYKGPKFTWCNNRKGHKRIYERIDKGLASPLWYSLFPNSDIKHLPIQCSDHAPIIFDTGFFEPHKRKSFRMEAWAFEYEDSLRLLQQEWFIYDRGSPVTKLSKKLQRTRSIFKEWTLAKRKSWNEKWSEFDERLEHELQKIFEGHNEEGYRKWHENYLEFNKAATIYWKQRAKLHWIKDGDASTRFFFNSVKHRHNRSLIIGIKKVDSSWTFDRQEISDIFNDHFKGIYGLHDDHDSFQQYQASHQQLFGAIKTVLSSDQQDYFSFVFTRKEIRMAVFQLGPTKSPGPDGVPAIFYQKFWCHIKTEVEDAVLFMLNTGTIPSDFNRTASALIPKVNSPKTVDNFRPISLCNVIIKIVTKCISNRLKKVMPILVGDYQNGFVPGRNIGDNILLSHELLHHISKKRFGKRCLLAVKMDMSKAYDRLNWNFVKCTLLSMNFPSNFVQLIMNCITSVSYEVLINGSPGKSFRPKAGIRQGDPMSPYIFALCTEVLSQLLCDAQDRNLMKGIQLSRNAPRISHLLFADDSIFFMDAKISHCVTLMGLLNLYGDASGQHINDAKTTITISPNCTLRNYRECLKVLKALGNKGIGKYLGLPTDFGSSKKEIFATIYDKVRSRILSWNNNYLSSAGRLTLINSILSSLSLFSLSVFQIPVSVSSKINSLLSQFWWGGTVMRQSLNWCSNLFINASKSGGGLGIRNIRCLNQSLLAKIGWKILFYPNSLIARVLGPKYKISSRTVLNSSFVKRGTQSWGERGVHWGLRLLRNHLSWQVGCPSFLDIWKDKWIYGLSLGQLLGLSDHEIYMKPALNVCHLQNADGTWKVDVVYSLCGETMAPYILSIPLSSEDFDDSLFWALNKNGRYSVKSGYAVAFSHLWSSKATIKDHNRIDAASIAFCKNRLWVFPIQGKWKTFIWKLLSNSLPTGSEASKRNLPWNYQCKLCASFDNQIESLEHLFRDCSIASHFWAGSPLGIRSSIGANVSIQAWVINWISFLIKDSSPNSCILFVSTLWRIWCLRNDLLYRSDLVMDFSSQITTLTTDAINNSTAAKHRLISSANIFASTNMDIASIRNHSPFFLIGDSLCPSAIRLKCDASWRLDFRASAGWIFLDSHGRVIHSGQSRFWAGSALQAEATAFLHALLDAVNQGFYHIDAQTDCLSLALQLTECVDVHQELKSILCSITSLLPSCHCCSISHCPRVANRIAHRLAANAMC